MIGFAGVVFILSLFRLAVDLCCHRYHALGLAFAITLNLVIAAWAGFLLFEGAYVHG